MFGTKCINDEDYDNEDDEDDEDDEDVIASHIATTIATAISIYCDVQGMITNTTVPTLRCEIVIFSRRGQALGLHSWQRMDTAGSSWFSPGFSPWFLHGFHGFLWGESL